MAYPLFHPESVEPVPVFLSADAFRAAFPGESEFVEFKQGIAADQIQQVAVAFSNVDGGVLLVGVAPDGRVVGVADSAVTRDRIYGALGLARQLGRYALDALDRHGALKGGYLTVHRLCRCQPWGGHGYDPVPGADPAFDKAR